MGKNNKYEDLPGVHHFYLGLFVLAIGFWLTWVHWIPSNIVLLLGLWIIIDDHVQHTKNQIIKKQNDDIMAKYARDNTPGLIVPVKRLYVSFLHSIFSKYLWKFKIVRKITGFFDRIFGRKSK